jgi:hypothetical protein
MLAIQALYFLSHSISPQIIFRFVGYAPKGYYLDISLPHNSQIPEASLLHTPRIYNVAFKKLKLSVWF